MNANVPQPPQPTLTRRPSGQGADNASDLAAEGALAEFAALRTEALQAFSTQSNIVAIQLTATSVVFSFALTSHSRTRFLLIIPVVCYILNGRYLRAERLVLMIASYIMTDLSPRVQGSLRWESWIRDQPSPRQKLRWSAHGPLIFSVTSIFALTWVAPYIFSADGLSIFNRVLLSLIWAMGLALTLLSIYTIKVVIIGEDAPLRGLVKFLTGPGRGS
jgi:hypothetical protein